MPEKRAADESAEFTAPSTTIMEHSGVTAWYFTTIAAYVPTTTLKNLFSLPFRAADHFLQPQELRVETIIREDGAHKKRLIDAGGSDPAAPTRASSPRSSPRAAAAPSPHSGSPPRPKAQAGSRWRARATAAVSTQIIQNASPLQAHISRARQARRPPPPVTGPSHNSPMSLSTEDQIWAPTPLSYPKINYTNDILPKNIPIPIEDSSPANSPCSSAFPERPGRRVRFNNEVQVKQFYVPYTVPEEDKAIYQDEVMDAVDEWTAKQIDLLRRAERAKLEDGSEVDGYSSEFKEDVGTPPRLPSPVMELLPPPWMIRDLYERQKNAAIVEEHSQMEDSFSEDKELRSNTYLNSLPIKHDVNELPSELKDYIHDESSSEFKEFVGGESSSETKENVGSSSPRPSTPIDQSLRYLQLAEELFDDSIVIASTPLRSPSPPRAADITPLVAPLTALESDNLNKIAQENATNDRAVVADLPTIKLLTHDFGTLLPNMFKGHANGWLNDNIVNEYLDILVNYVKEKEGYVHVRGRNGVAPPVHAFKSQWFTSMEKSPDSTARWARPANLSDRKLLDCNLVLIPICNGSHWRLLAIKPKERTIEYYDSLHNAGTQYTKAALDWVKLVLKEHYVEGEWSIAKHQKSEEQVNARDCGVFTVLNALVLLRGEEHNRVIVSDGMDDARLRIAATLLAGKPTTEMD